MRFSGLIAAIVLVLPAAVFGQEPIVDGAYMEGMSGGQGSVQSYYLDVPEGATDLRVSLSGGSGNADLHVEHSSGTPTCAPHAGGNGETCVFEAPAPGRWFVELHGVTEYADATLFGWSLTRLQPGVAFTGIVSGEVGGRWFYLDVPENATAVRFATHGGSGDSDLIIGDDPDGDSDCVSVGPGTNEQCEVAAPAPGRWYALVWSFDQYQGVSLTGSYSMPGDGVGDEAQGLGRTAAAGALSPLAPGILLLLRLAALRRRRAPAP